MKICISQVENGFIVEDVLTTRKWVCTKPEEVASKVLELLLPNEKSAELRIQI